MNEQSSHGGAPAEEERARAAPTEEERARAAREQLKALRGVDLVYGMIVELVTYGIQKLGLTEQTRELRDLGDARVAIDLLRAALDVLEREAGAPAVRDLRATLAQLQLGYATAVGTGPAEPAPAADERAGEAEEPAQGGGDAPAAAAGEEAPGVPDAEPAAENEPATEREPAARKPAVKKPAVKKPAAKKPAAKKPRGGATPPAG